MAHLIATNDPLICMTRIWSSACAAKNAACWQASENSHAQEFLDVYFDPLAHLFRDGDMPLSPE